MSENLSKVYTPEEFENDMYKWWEEKKLFKPETQLELGIVTPDDPVFCNTIPPPNVTGVLHLGHAITIAIQDLMVRYNRMRGKRALFLPGADHAGIATQNVVERELNKKGIQRKELGRDKFIEEVWKWKEHSLSIIVQQSKKMGISSDWDRDRFTMDNQLSKAVREAFVTLYKRDLIYRGNYLVNWCPGRCESAISDLEAEPKETTGQLWYIKYPITSKEWRTPKGEWGSGNWAKGAKNFIEVATTRPETLLGDTAVAINKDHPVFGKYLGKKTVIPVIGRKVEIIHDDHVDTEFGTGAVKVTPAHDPNDFEMGQRHNLEFITMMNQNGVIDNEYGGKYAGMDRFEARKLLVEDLKQENLLIKVEDYTHSVPHCQRCDTVVEPRMSLQWFVRSKILTKKVINKIESQGLVFVPPKQKERLYQWINPETIRDWCISRQLWWGHRIPVWYCLSCEHQNTGLEDPVKCEKCDSEDLQQDEDVLDTWFSSSLWPFSTMGWPENTKDMADFFPNQMRETGYDILFFWVARELMMSVELTGKIPYETVYFHGLVRNEEGKKISKSMENIEDYDPLKIIAQYGADTLRYTLISYSTPGMDMNLDPKNLDGVHKFGNKLWQAVRYVLGNISEDFIPIKIEELSIEELETSDRWILSELHSMLKTVTKAYENYAYLESARDIRKFFWNTFADWYIEISKLRIYDENYNGIDPRHVLVNVIDKVLRVLHPIMPFITEKLWQQLPKPFHDQQSLMVSKWPNYSETFINKDLTAAFTKIMQTISDIRKIRGEFTVPHSQLVNAIIVSDDISLFESSEREITALARVDPSTLKITQKIDPPIKVITAVSGNTTIYIPFEGLIDVKEELNRIDKELAKLESFMSKIEKKLNSDFAQRAPPEVVSKEKNKFEELAQQKLQLVGRQKILKN
jgi:valyl-tRNA synthetase